MRFIFCFTILLALTRGKKFSREEEFKKVHDECQSDPATHVGEEVLEKFRYGEELEDKSLGLHIFCMNTKLNIQEKSGEINKDTIKRDLQDIYHTPDVINDIVEECGAAVGETKYDVAKNVYECLHKYADQGHNSLYHRKRENEYKKAAKECDSNEETDAVDKEEVKKVLAGENVDSPKLHKYIHCIAKKVEVVKENGELNEEVVKHDLQDSVHDEGKVKEIIKQCSVISSENLEEVEKVAKMFKCIHNHKLSYQKDKSNKRHELKENFKKMDEECQADSATKADTEILRKFAKGEEVNDHQVGKHILCINKKIGIQLENGNVDKESIKNYLKIIYDDEERITEILNECAVKNKGDSEVVSGMKIFRCLHQTLQNHHGMSQDGAHYGHGKTKL